MRPEFWAMGGYGAYVWPAYGLFALVVVWNIVAAVRSEARMLAAAKRRLAMSGAGDRGAQNGTP